jgi:hypothetical protein
MVATAARSPSHHKAVLTTTKRQPRRLRGRRSRADAARVGSTSPGLFPPIPSEVVLPLAGFFVGRGDFAFLGALLAATTGSTTGALVLYGLGRCGGRALVLRYGGWLRVSEEDLERAKAGSPGTATFSSSAPG